MRRFLITGFAISFLCLTVSVQARTWHVDPKKGDMKNDGSQAKPWSRLDEVVAAGKLKAVKPEDTILLYSGYHGDVTISGGNTGKITITAAENHKPQLSRFEIRSGSKWHVKGLTVSPSFGKEPYKGRMISIGENGASEDLVVENCFLYTTLDTSKWKPKDWMQANSGIWVGRHGTKLTVRNNYIMNVRFGIDMCAPDSMCEGNVIVNFSADAIRVTRDGQTVQYNVIRNVYCSEKDGDNNHDDGIQCFLFNRGRGTVRNVTVRSNLIINREDDRQKYPNGLQAIGFFDGPLVEFRVEKNVALVSHWHGISLYDAQKCRVKNNSVYSRWHKVRERPWVMIGQKINKSRDNIVQGNIAHSFSLRADKSIINRDNKIVTKDQFYKRFRELRGEIDDKFGLNHPTSGLRRVDDKEGN